MACFQRFLGPQTKAEHIYTDGSKEFEKAITDLQTSKDILTPYMPQTNGAAERQVRKAKNGIANTLVQSGWNAKMWD